MISFGQPWLLALLALVPFLWGLWLFGAARGARRMRAVSRTRVTGPPIVASFLLALAVGSAIIAAAQPQWGERDAFIPRRGADMFFVLDVSRSMGARDAAPDRLDAAKAAIAATFERLGGDRAGLVIYAGDAVVRSPLTADLEVATRIVETLEPGPILVGSGSAASSGLDLAIDAFDPESGAGRLIVLITDGDDLGVDPAVTAARLRDSGIGFVVAGVGTADGGPVPVVDQETGESADLLDASGQPVITRLNEPFLQALAAAAGGQYLGNDLNVVPGVVASRMSGLNTAQFDERSATIPIERAQWFAAAAVVLALAAALAERFRPRRRQTAAIAFVTAIALLLGSCATEAYNSNEAGLEAYEAGDYASAVDQFIEAQAQQPDDAAIALNLAAALHADGRYDEGVIAARRSLSSTSSRWRAEAQASIGHQRFALGDLPGALDAFKQALLEDPDEDKFRHDYEVVLRLLTPPPESEPGGPPAPGEQPTQPPGEGSEPGEGGESGDGGEPGEGGESGEGAEPGEGNEPGEGGESGEGSQPAEELSDAEIEERLTEIDAEVASLLEAAGEDLSAAEALAILRLLQEHSRIGALRAGGAAGQDRLDY